MCCASYICIMLAEKSLYFSSLLFSLDGEDLQAPSHAAKTIGIHILRFSIRPRCWLLRFSVQFFNNTNNPLAAYGVVCLDPMISCMQGDQAALCCSFVMSSLRTSRLSDFGPFFSREILTRSLEHLTSVRDERIRQWSNGSLLFRPMAIEIQSSQSNLRIHQSQQSSGSSIRGCPVSQAQICSGSRWHGIDRLFALAI